MNSKLVKLFVGICAASLFAAGCGDADSHPSQMTKIRNSMQQQKDSQRSGMTTAPMPGTTGGTAGGNGGGTTGQ